MWVDAVCINQSDVAERASQVAMMGSIYSTAKHVDIWLGSPTSTAWIRVCRFLANVHRSPFGYGREHTHHLNKGWSPWLAHCVERLRAALWIITRTPQSIEEALHNSEPKWADRLWCVQECILAKDLSLCCGRTRTPCRSGLSLEELCFTWYTYCGMSSSDWDELEDDPPLCALEGLITQYRKQTGCRSLLEAAQLTRSTAVSDLRDRLFALFGIVPEYATGDLDTRPDYTLETWQVYAKGTFASMVAVPCHADNCLNTLALASVDSAADISLPGWAFDFRYVGAWSPPEGLSVGWYRHTFPCDDEPYKYWSGYSMPNNSLTALSADLRQLKVSAVRFATLRISYSNLADPSNLASDESSVVYEDPGSLYTCFSEARLRAVAKAARYRLVNEGFEDLLDQRINVGGCDRIAFWHGDRHLAEELDILGIVSADLQDGIPDSQDMIQFLLEDWDFTVVLRSPRDGRRLSLENRLYETSEILRSFYDYARLRAPQHTLDFFATSNGFLGLGIAEFVAGDLIVLIKGCKWPVVLREDGDYWAFKGICLVHGIMEGELLQIWNDLGLEEEEFVLG